MKVLTEQDIFTAAVPILDKNQNAKDYLHIDSVSTRKLREILQDILKEMGNHRNPSQRESAQDQEKFYQAGFEYGIRTSSKFILNGFPVLFKNEVKK